MVKKVYCVEHNPAGKIMCAGQAFHISYCHSCGIKMVFATTYDEILCEKCSSKYNQCAKCATTDLNNNSKERNIEKGRVEGAKQELKDTLTTLKAIDSELDRRNVDMMLKTLIKIKEKRLKELNKGGNE